MNTQKELDELAPVPGHHRNVTSRHHASIIESRCTLGCYGRQLTERQGLTVDFDERTLGVALGTQLQHSRERAVGGRYPSHRMLRPPLMSNVAPVM